MRQRTAFTILEMLVVMALTLFIMVILAQAFSTSLDVFRQLKAIGDMEEGLRGASTLLRSDLAADHFTGRRRLSDPDIWRNRPTEGFVRVFTTTTGALTAEGNDGAPTNIVSQRVTNRGLHLAVKLRGNSRDSLFTASVPNGSPLLTPKTTFLDQPVEARFQEPGSTTFNTPWAEVAWVLVKTGTTAAPNDATSTLGTPLHALYRVQFAVVPDNSNLIPPAATVVPANQLAAYPGLSCKVNGANLYFNNPNDLITQAKRRFDPTTPLAAGSVPDGGTLVLSNVISFNVRCLQSGALRTAAALTNPVNHPGKLPAVDPTTINYTNLAFDTGATATTTNFVVKALEITIRVFDQKTQQTRQVTVIQDM